MDLTTEISVGRVTKAEETSSDLAKQYRLPCYCKKQDKFYYCLILCCK